MVFRIYFVAKDTEMPSELISKGIERLYVSVHDVQIASIA